MAVAALGAPGRYARAAALDVLERLAREGGPLGATAARFAAAHAERGGASLSAIEVDRILAILAHDPRGEEAAARLRALVKAGDDPAHAAQVDPAASALLPRAKAVAEGNAAGPRPENEGRVLLGWLSVAAVAALRAENRHEARDLLRELDERIRAGARVEAPSWTAAVFALRDARLKPEGAALAQALLAADGDPPPRGFTWVADALDAADAESLSVRALERAVSRREPEARARLSALTRERGWRAADAGDRDEALALLKRARALAEPTGS